MKNYELINELMMYPAYCEVKIEISREFTDSGETVAHNVGIDCSELCFMEDFGDCEITLHPCGEIEEKDRYAYKKDTMKWATRRDGEGRIIKKGMEWL